jgi:hypothetical protein
MNGERNVQSSTGSGHGSRDLATLIGLALVIASIVRELRLPNQKRTWHGVLFGKIPYDLRPPSFNRLRAVIWDPQNSQMVVPTAFGVGWTVNLAALRARLSGGKAA